MATLAIIGIIIFLIIIFITVIIEGTQNSISQLANQQYVLLLIALLSQITLLPQMLQMTPSSWTWLPFLGVSGILVCGAANVINKDDQIIHMISALVTFICFVSWIIIINPYYLMPLIVCTICGREKLTWRCEVGLISSVYTAIILGI